MLPAFCSTGTRVSPERVCIASIFRGTLWRRVCVKLGKIHGISSLFKLKKWGRKAQFFLKSQLRLQEKKKKTSSLLGSACLLVWLFCQSMQVLTCLTTGEKFTCTLQINLANSLTLPTLTHTPVIKEVTMDVHCRQILMGASGHPLYSKHNNATVNES